MADEVEVLRAVFGADISQFEDAIEQGKGLLGGLKSAFSAIPFATLFDAAVNGASEQQQALAQLDAALKSTAQATSASAAEAGHWAISTGLSAQQADKMREQLSQATAKMHDLQYAQAHSKRFSEEQALALQKATKEVSDLTGKLAVGTATTKVWVEATGASAGAAQSARDELIGYADSMSKITRFSDDVVIKGEAMMLTFTSIGKDVFPEAMTAAMDLSTAMGQDLNSSVLQIGKALNDPIRGLTALRRVGVQFTDDQERMIRSLVNSGRTMDAQKMILRELNTEFGGSAKAAGETFAGKLDILKNTFEKLMATVGDAVLPILSGFVEIATRIVGAIQEVDPGLLQLAGLFTGLVVASGPVIAALGFILSPIGLIGAAVVALAVAWQTNFGGIRDFTNGLVSAVAAPLENIKNIVQNFFKTLFDQGPSKKEVKLAEQLGIDASDPIFAKAKDFGTRLGEALSKALPDLGKAFADLIGGGVSFLTTKGVELINGAFKLVFGIDFGKFLEDPIGAIKKMFDGLFGPGGTIPKLISGGIDLIGGLFKLMFGENTPVGKAITSLQNFFKLLFGPEGYVPKIISMFGDIASKLFTSIFGEGSAIKKLIDGAGAFFSKVFGAGGPVDIVLNGIKTAIDKVAAAIGAVIDQLTKLLGFKDMSFNAPDIRDSARAAALDGGGKLDMFNGGGRADGGYVQAGAMYMVNERKQEFFIPSTSGKIDNDPGGRGGGGGISIGQVILQGVQDPAAMLAALEREAKKRNIRLGTAMG